MVAYLERVGFFDDCGRVMEIAAAGPAALSAVVEAADTSRPARTPCRRRRSRRRWSALVAPLVREKMDVLAEFIPMAGWFFKPLSFTDESLAAPGGHAGG